MANTHTYSQTLSSRSKLIIIQLTHCMAWVTK